MINYYYKNSLSSTYYFYFFFLFSIRESSGGVVVGGGCTYPGGLTQTKTGSMGQKIVVYVRVARMGAFLLYYRRGMR